MGGCRAPRWSAVLVRLVSPACSSKPSDRVGELSAGLDLELPVGAAEVHFHRLDRDEEGLGDLLVGHAFGGHPGDPALARRQRLDAGQHQFAWSRAHGGQFVLRMLNEPRRAGPVGELEPSAKRLLCVPTAVRPAQYTSQVDERPGVLEPRPGGFEHRNGMAEVRLAAAPTLHQSQSAERYPDRARRPPPAGQLEFLTSELGGYLALSELQYKADLTAATAAAAASS